MDNLWAPWRMKFIEDLRDTQQGCFFCRLLQEGDDRERLVLCRLKHAYVVMNKFPYNNGHVLLVPKSHTGRLIDLSDQEQRALSFLNAQAVEILMQKLNAEGANCGVNIGRAGGAGIVDHVHVHIVPRWNGDTNFMPIISDTRSMPEYLESTYDRMAGAFSELQQKAGDL